MAAATSVGFSEAFDASKPSYDPLDSRRRSVHFSILPQSMLCRVFHLDRRWPWCADLMFLFFRKTLTALGHFDGLGLIHAQIRTLSSRTTTLRVIMSVLYWPSCVLIAFGLSVNFLYNCCVYCLVQVYIVGMSLSLCNCPPAVSIVDSYHSQRLIFNYLEAPKVGLRNGQRRFSQISASSDRYRPCGYFLGISSIRFSILALFNLHTWIWNWDFQSRIQGSTSLQMPKWDKKFFL